MTARPRKVHVESDRRRYLGYDRGVAVVMLCGAGWGDPLDSTPTPEDATCKRCLSIAAGPKPKIEHGPIHMSRTFEGFRIEDACPCPQEPCGFVSMENVIPECEHHPWQRAKTMRRMHPASHCPGARE